MSEGEELDRKGEDADEIETNEDEDEEILDRSRTPSTEHLNHLGQHNNHHHSISHQLLASHLQREKTLNNNSISSDNDSNTSSNNNNNFGSISAAGSFLLGHLSRGSASGRLSASLSSSGGQKKYPCGQCGRSLTDLASLQRHLR